MSTNMDNVEGNVPIEEHESDNEKSKPKRKRMKDRSEVWEHFIKEETHTGMEARCKWNSTFLMLDAALVFEYAFERYSEEDPHYVIELNEREGKGCPTSEDWETVRRRNMNKYWGDPEKMNMLIFIVVVLDPRYKLDYVEWMLIEIYDSKHAFVLVNNLKESLNALYEEYRGSFW
uniref:hAT-like transposase RNase-H fold domain-containing protein n=1 Tax=Chenopodium quinoa TaxID=63459 RepID=A0A803LIG0_CHEQI